MKNGIVWGLALLALLAPPPLRAGGLAFAQAQLERSLAPEEFESLDYFPFTNRGDVEVTILDVSTDCGCAVGMLEKRKYAPGESGRIAVKFRPGSRAGDQLRRVAISTNEASEPVYHLSLKFSVSSALTFEATQLQWQNPDPVPEKTIRAKLAPGYEKTAVETRSLHGFVRIDQNHGSEAPGYVSFTVTPKAAAGAFEDWVLISVPIARTQKTYEIKVVRR